MDIINRLRNISGFELLDYVLLSLLIFSIQIIFAPIIVPTVQGIWNSAVFSVSQKFIYLAIIFVIDLAVASLASAWIIANILKDTNLTKKFVKVPITRTVVLEIFGAIAILLIVVAVVHFVGIDALHSLQSICSPQNLSSTCNVTRNAASLLP
jgi:small-conductance mechanosensitive channel